MRDNTAHNASLPFPLNCTVHADFMHEQAFVVPGTFNATGKDSPDQRDEEGEDVEHEGAGASWCEDGFREDEGMRDVQIVSAELQPLEFCGACMLDNFDPPPTSAS